MCKTPGLPESGAICSAPVPVGAEIQEGRNLSHKTPSWREPGKLVLSEPGKTEAHLVSHRFPQALSQ
jgi:hypothetical protein